MAEKLSASEMQDYVGNSGERVPFFTIKDGEQKYVRFLHAGLDDITRYAVHRVSIKTKEGNRERTVACLRKKSDPLDKCPICKCGKFNISSKMWLELLVYEKDKKGEPTGDCERVIWERGPGFAKKMQYLFDTYCKKGKELCDTVFAITRIGKKNDTNTQYEFSKLDYDEEECPFDELPEESYDPLGGLVVDADAEAMERFLETGSFLDNTKNDDDDDDDEDELPRRKKSKRKVEDEDDEEEEEEEEKPSKRKSSKSKQEDDDEEEDEEDEKKPRRRSARR